MISRFIYGFVLSAALFAVAAPTQSFANEGGGHQAAGEKDDASALNPVPMSWGAFQKDLAVWTAVVFLFLLIILGKFAWKPVVEGLDKRENFIADQLAQAEANNKKAQELFASYEKRLADSENEVRAIIEKGRRDAEQVGHDLIEKAKTEATAEKDRAIRQIDTAALNAAKDLADRSATLAVELAGKIVQSRLNVADHAKLIEQAVSRFAKGDGASKN